VITRQSNGVQVKHNKFMCTILQTHYVCVFANYYPSNVLIMNDLTAMQYFWYSSSEAQGVHRIVVTSANREDNTNSRADGCARDSKLEPLLRERTA
jgi:hypothetical protein